MSRTSRTLETSSSGENALSSMRYSSHYVIPELPPAEVLAELDLAARALDELTARAAELTLGMDEQTRGIRIDFHDDGKSHRLAPP